MTYSAAYSTSKVAGIPAQVAGGFPPAVLTLYISSKLPVAPTLVTNLSQATAPNPTSPCPTEAPAGAGTVLFFEHGAKPNCIEAVFKSKVGVVELAKKWCPEMARLDGERVAWSADVRLNCSATFGSCASRSG